MPLVDTTQLEALRAVAYEGLDTDVTILRRTDVAANPYGDDEEAYVDQGIVKGWLRSMSTARLDEIGGDLVAAVGVFRLHVPHDTDIRPGDRVGVEGEIFTVQDTNEENTIKVFLTCTLRRAQ